MEVITLGGLVQGYEYAIHGKVLYGQKLAYSKANLEKKPGKIRPLNSGNSHNLRNSLPNDRIVLVVISFWGENPPQDVGLFPLRF
jgi:hypothetical protein